jgi:hypothetical protein
MSVALTRRQFVLAAAGTASTRIVASAQSPITETLGEPVRLLGSRLAFTGWHWVRPGGFSWVTPTKGGRLQEYVLPDEARVRRTDVAWGVKLVTHAGERVGPILEAEARWEEGAGVKFTTLLKEQGIYRAWSLPAHTSGRPRGQRFFMYFESEDGMHWKRPNLGLFEYEGSRANNILNQSTHDYTKATPETPMEYRKPELFNGTVFIDPSAPPAERYKVFASGNISQEAFERYKRQRPNEIDWRDKEDLAEPGSKAVRGAVSPDGIRWTVLPDALVVEPSDTLLVAYYDENLRKYVAYTRKRVGLRRASGFTIRDSRTTDPLRRCIGRSETADFRRFPVSEVVLEAMPYHDPGDELYANCRTAVPGAPDHHLMFPTVWSNWDDTTQFPLASSAEGVRWHFLPGSPVFGTAPFGAWDGGSVFVAPNLTEMRDGSWVLPYGGFNVPHKYPRAHWKFAQGYARWRDGRLVGIRSDVQGGFATLGVVPTGRRVFLNAVSTRAGGVRMEVAGLDGKPLPGRSFKDCSDLVGDHRRGAMSWRGETDLGHAEGQAVILRFQVEQATIYWVDFA